MTSFRIALVIAAATVAGPATAWLAAAQWLSHPTADIPRKADGKPDLTAPAPRSADGKPIIAGLWRPAPGIVGNITRGMNGAEVPYIRLTRINARVSEATLSHAGKPFGTARREIAQDGMTMVITFQQDSQRRIYNVAHYVKVTP